MIWHKLLRKLFPRGESRPQSGLPRTDTFCPAEWDAFFATLDRECRSRGASRLCATVVSRTAVESLLIQRALSLVGRGTNDQETLSGLESLLEQCENRYENLVGRDERKLMGDDPEVREAFDQARAASAILCALRGEYTRMAYEACTVIGEHGVLSCFLEMLPTQEE